MYNDDDGCAFSIVSCLIICLILGVTVHSCTQSDCELEAVREKKAHYIVNEHGNKVFLWNHDEQEQK